MSGCELYGIRELPGCSRDATPFVSRIASRPGKSKSYGSDTIISGYQGTENADSLGTRIQPRRTSTSRGEWRLNIGRRVPNGPCLRNLRRGLLDEHRLGWASSGREIIAQISTATGIDTCTYSKRESVSGTTGANWPSAIPPATASATHRVKKRSNRPMPCSMSGWPRS